MDDAERTRDRSRAAPGVPLGSASRIRGGAPPAVIIMGPPGSGKSTQARALAARLGWEEIDTGAVVRAMHDVEGPLGEWVRSSYATGTLAPPPLVAELVVRAARERLARGTGLIFHGSPRTLREAEALLPLIAVPERVGRNVLFLLDIPRPVSVYRITHRWLCTTCGYAASSHTPVETCPNCGGRCERRRDDTAEAMVARWDAYAFRTEPVTTFLARRLPLVRVDGNRPIAEITEDLLRHIAEQFGVQV